MNIVWLEADSLSVDLPRPDSPHDWTQFPFTETSKVRERIAQADILIVNKVTIGEPELKAAPNLKAIAVTATGTDNIDSKACAARGVQVRNVVNYGPQAVAEHAFACLLQLVRRVPEWQQLVHNGSWSQSRFFCLHTLPMRSLNQMTLGILGNGAIGQKLAHYARSFDMDVLTIERPGASGVRAGYVSFEEGLSRVDVLSLHCPLNDQTKGLMNEANLRAMKKGSVLINTARGGLVDFDSLKTVLLDGHLDGAALDVLDTEPPPADHPMVQWSHPRLIVTPHVAWGTLQAQTRVAELTLENLENFLKSTA
ncbi:MAG: D-2-hydroxyacid dehydrogenase [Limnobacter sp.]|nr:D-2-hydroxyacid dehydrogenase [Limnobacter sp.]